VEQYNKGVNQLIFNNLYLIKIFNKIKKVLMEVAFMATVFADQNANAQIFN
jgi:hypothetical protein